MVVPEKKYVLFGVLFLLLFSVLFVFWMQSAGNKFIELSFLKKTEETLVPEEKKLPIIELASEIAGYSLEKAADFSRYYEYLDAIGFWNEDAVYTTLGDSITTAKQLRIILTDKVQGGGQFRPTENDNKDVLTSFRYEITNGNAVILLHINSDVAQKTRSDIPRALTVKLLQASYLIVKHGVVNDVGVFSEAGKQVSQWYKAPMVNMLRKKESLWFRLQNVIVPKVYAQSCTWSCGAVSGSCSNVSRGCAVNDDCTVNNFPYPVTTGTCDVSCGPASFPEDGTSCSVGCPPGWCVADYSCTNCDITPTIAPTSTPDGSIYCGDKICNNGENCSICFADCGACPPPNTCVPMYYCRTDTHSCGGTLDTYDSTSYVDCPNPPNTCQQNIALNIPNNNGVCYQSLSDCQSACAAPTCIDTSPNSNPTISSTLSTYYVYAFGVSNASSVLFATWSTTNGQDDLVWYPGTNLGAGTWRATVNFANHTGLGQYNVHVYMDGSSTFCGYANFIRAAPSPTPTNTGTPMPINGVCAATHNNCISGTSFQPSEVSWQWTWRCLGLNGGASDWCSEPKPTNTSTPTMTNTPTNTPSPSPVPNARIIVHSGSLVSTNSPTCTDTKNSTQYISNEISVNGSVPQAVTAGSTANWTAAAGTYTVSDNPPAGYVLQVACWETTPTTGGPFNGLTGDVAANQDITWWLGYSDAVGWTQIEGGDVTVLGDIDSYISDGADPQLFELDGDGGTPGVVTQGGTFDFDPSSSSQGEANVSSTGWHVTESQSVTDWYSTMYHRLGEPTTSNYADGATISSKPASSATPYYVNGDLTINGSNWSVTSGQNIIFLINGNLTISNDIAISGTGYVAFIVNGDITVSPCVGNVYSSSVAALEGVYITSPTGTFHTGQSTCANNERLVVHGSVIAGRLALERDLSAIGQNNTTSAELFSYDPGMLVAMPDSMKDLSITWQEVAP